MKRATVISFANQKGGCGKSTVTLLTANTISQKPYNLKVLVIDADLQRTISKERESDKKKIKTFPYPILKSSIFDKKIIDDVKENISSYDVILIDIPGMLYTNDSQKQEIAIALSLCNLILIPIQPTKPSIRASVEFLQTCREVEKIKKEKNFDFEVACFINQKKNTTESKKSLPKLIEKLGINYLGADLSERVYFTRTFDTYTSIILDKGNYAATNEFRKFITALLKMLKNQKLDNTVKEIMNIL